MGVVYTSTSVVVVRFDRDGATESSVPKLGHIIVPLDGSDTAAEALTPARGLALRTGAHVSLVTTHIEEGDDTADYLDEAASKLDGVATEIVLRAESDPVDAINALLSESDETTWIVMRSHGRGRVKQAVLGSVAERIVADVAAPVMVVGPAYDAETHFADGPVVVAHDAAHAPDAEVAAMLCRAAESRAVVLEVRSPVPELQSRGGGPLTSPAVLVWADQLREFDVEVDTELRPGASMPRAAADEAREIGASCVLVTSRAQTGMRRFILGSHMAATVRNSPVPVVVVRAKRASG